jgi:DNA (cytosine-5)-methyltransferase 1
MIFSGAGAGGVGASKVGFDVSYIIEPRTAFVPKTWEVNFPKADWSRDLHKFRKRQVDLIVGSPPCSKYSLLNRTKTRMDLYATNPLKVEYTAFLREIIERQPTAFILENLPRIRQFLFFSYNPEDPTFYVNYYSKKKLHMETRPVLVVEGYHIHQYVIDAVDVGLAQTRKRLFIIGVKTGYPWSWDPPQVKNSEWLTRAIRAIPEDAPNNQKDWLSIKEQTLWRKLAYKQKSDVNRKVRKMPPKEPCATIVSASLRYYHYKEPRYLTPRECARIQGYPDDFLFCGSTRQQLNQIGKSIAPPIVQALARQIKASIESVEQLKFLDELMS